MPLAGVSKEVSRAVDVGRDSVDSVASGLVGYPDRGGTNSSPSRRRFDHHCLATLDRSTSLTPRRISTSDATSTLWSANGVQMVAGSNPVPNRSNESPALSGEPGFRVSS